MLSSNTQKMVDSWGREELKEERQWNKRWWNKTLFSAYSPESQIILELVPRTSITIMETYDKTRQTLY